MTNEQQPVCEVPAPAIRCYLCHRYFCPNPKTEEEARAWIEERKKAPAQRPPA